MLLHDGLHLGYEIWIFFLETDQNILVNLVKILINVIINTMQKYGMRRYAMLC